MNEICFNQQYHIEYYLSVKFTSEQGTNHVDLFHKQPTKGDALFANKSFTWFLNLTDSIYNTTNYCMKSLQ